MPARPVRPAFAALHARIALIEGDGGPARGSLPFGVPDLDRRLRESGHDLLRTRLRRADGSQDGAPRVDEVDA